MSYRLHGNRALYLNPPYQASPPYGPPPERCSTQTEPATEIEEEIRVTYAFNDSVTWNSSTGVLWAIHDYLTGDEVGDERN